MDSIAPTGSISSTNNVAASQTVTLSLSDNVGVAGYYWGTSSTYSNNTYTATSSTSVTKTISSAGTYYLTVKDTSGNVSTNYSITFYKTTLNANGGSVSPTAVLTRSGNSFTFPVPTIVGSYTYAGWSTSSSATSGVTTLKPTSNGTYYAVWNSVLNFGSDHQFYFSNNHYIFNGCCYGQFINGVCYCGHCSYKMLDSDFNKLANYVKAYYGSNTTNSNTVINKLQDERDSSWGGSCYGMAATVLLDRNNRIGFNENFDPDAKTMREVDAPYQNSKVQSAINYYMISQFIGFTRTGDYFSKNYNQASWSSGLKQLVNKAKNGDTLLFCYWFSEGGHAIVIKSYQSASDGGHNLIAYDNRYPDIDVIVKIDKNYKTCVVNDEEDAVAVEYLSDLSAFDLIDIDGPNNDMVIRTTPASHVNKLTRLDVVADGTVTITNKEGQTLTVSEDGTISGTMDIVSMHLIVRDNADGSPAPATLSFYVNDSKSFTAEGTEDTLSFSVQNDTIYASAETKNADMIIVGEDEGIYLLGENIEYSANLSLNNHIADMVALDGTSKHNVNMLFSDESIEVKGAQAGESTLTVFSNVTDIDTYCFDSSYNDVLITDDNNGDLTVLASSKGDGNFDIMLVGNNNDIQIKNYVPIRTVAYKTTITFTALTEDASTGSTVHWFVNDKDVGTGESYTVKQATSDYTVQCKLVDENGWILAESEIETVKISNGFFARLIAFFRSLFGSLPVISQTIKETI